MTGTMVGTALRTKVTGFLDFASHPLARWASTTPVSWARLTGRKPKATFIAVVISLGILSFTIREVRSAGDVTERRNLPERTMMIILSIAPEAYTRDSRLTRPQGQTQNFRGI